jgi:hypothetical protein
VVADLPVGVAVGIDEARREGEPGSVDEPLVFSGGQVADRDDAVTHDANRCHLRLAAGAVVEGDVGDQRPWCLLTCAATGGQQPEASRQRPAASRQKKHNDFGDSHTPLRLLRRYAAHGTVGLPER